jgi:hypothetical protein
MTIATTLIPETLGNLGIVSFDNGFTFDDAIAVASNPKVRTLQAKGPIDTRDWHRVWPLINDIVLAQRTDIWLRIFGFYSETCDLSFLPLLPNARKLSIDRVLESKNLESLSELPHLNSLRLDVYDLKNYDFLSDIGMHICDLTLERTKSKKPDLKFLEGFKNLKSLCISGHTKNIEVLGELERLADLSLAGITVDNFHFIKSLQNLLSLNIDLIKCEDFYSLEDLMIKSFSMSEIRNMEDISFISGFRSLQELDLSCLNRVTHFPQLASKNTVRRMFIDNMKSLSSIEHIFKCKNLVDFIFRGASTTLMPQDFQPLTSLRKLKYATIGTGSERKNQKIDELLESAGIGQYEHYDFEYE